MKKFLTVMMLVAALTMAAPVLAQSDSALIAQLQAMIVKLQEQLAQLLSNPPAAPSVQLLYPNGGEVLVTKGTYPVIWSGANFPKGTGVTLTLKDSAGEISYLATELDNTGNWDWTIGEDIEPGTYTVGIFCDKQGVDEWDCSAKSYDSSNSTVKIVDERVNVPTTPSVSLSCTQEGLDGSISWSGKTAGDGLFWVDISRPGADSFAENTKTWNRSAEENSIDFRGFTRWDKIGTLALEPETSYLVRVSTGGQFSRVKSFKTPACATASAVRSPVEQILWPNGGETLEIGKTYVIKWAAENIPANGSITLTLKKTNTTSGENLYIKPELANTGSYWWTIPAGQPTGEYYVGVFCDLVDASGTCPGDRWDFSDRPIKIVNPAAPPVVGGGVVCKGDDFNRDLLVGSVGSDVITLHQYLELKGYGSFGQNQVFSEATAVALVKYQRAMGLPQTGYFGPLTRAQVAADRNRLCAPPEVAGRPVITRISSKANEDFAVDAGGQVVVEGSSLMGTTKDATGAYFVNDGKDQALITQWGDSLLRAMVPADLIPGNTYEFYVVTDRGISERVKVRVTSSMSNSLPKETILWPNGGETLEIGKTYVIKWAAENIPANGSITLTLKKTNTTSGENLYIKPELANTGSYWWTIPAGQPTGEYYVGVFCDLVDASGTCPGDRWDFSDRPIKIVDPSVKVVPAPVTGVPAPKVTTSCVDQSGSRYQNVAIKWEPAVSGEYRIQEKVIGGSTGYFDFTGGERIQTAGKNYAATRQYSNWGGKTIEYSVSSAAYGTSPVASVTLPQCPVSTEPTITLTSPRASQAFVIGQTYEIKWTSANFPANSSVSVALYNENKTAPVAWLIAEHPNTGVATWKVPEGQAIGTYYLAAVCDLTTPGGGQCTPGSIDFSDGPVTVARPTSSGAWKQLSGVAESLRSLFR